MDYQLYWGKCPQSLKPGDFLDCTHIAWIQFQNTQYSTHRNNLLRLRCKDQLDTRRINSAKPLLVNIMKAFKFLLNYSNGSETAGLLLCVYRKELAKQFPLFLCTSVLFILIRQPYLVDLLLFEWENYPLSSSGFFKVA